MHAPLLDPRIAFRCPVVSADLDDHLVEAGEIVRLGKPVRRPDFGYYILSRNDDPITGAGKELWRYLTGNRA